jgi:CelD/BcsL family acetyltransferase involved in cellulose biosynthesis
VQAGFPAERITLLLTVAVSTLSLRDPRWLQFASARPEALPVHHPAWALLLEECYDFASLALVHENDGTISAGMPVLQVRRPLGAVRWISLPFTDFAPPLGEAPEVERLAGELDGERAAHGVKQLEVRAPLPGGMPVTDEPPLLHTLPLDADLEVVESRFKDSVRRNVRKGERNGVTVRRGAQETDLVDAFYGLHVETRRRLGVPVQPRRFFRLLWRDLVAPGLGFVLLAEKVGRPIAAAVFLAWNGTVVYKYGASDPKWLSLRPNDVLFRNAIRWACANGYHTLDFGRTDAHAEGLRRFKLGWGCEESPLCYSVVGGEPPRLTPSDSTALAPLLRRSPAWVTRVVGELLYKYAA